MMLFRVLPAAAAVIASAAAGPYVRRLIDCLFYSAFDFMQAEIIRKSLHRYEPLLQRKVFLFRDYFEAVRRSLVAVYWGTCIIPLLNLVCLFTASRIIPVIDCAYILALTAWFVHDRVYCRTEAGDQRKHHIYNAYAPHKPAVRAEITRQKKQMRLSPAMGWLRTKPMDEACPATDDSEINGIKERLSRD